MNLLDELQVSLKNITHAECYWVAFSGGCDSHVLLHALHTLITTKRISNFKIAGLHVNHGLQDSAENWSEHCQQVCSDLAIEFKLLKVNAVANPGQSPEAAAREARYCAISNFMATNDALLLAHHQDDQAETLLLQLVRGAGPRGLSAMPRVKHIATNPVIRPLLNVSQECILAYAQQHRLSWIDDPSNNDIRFDRNRIRHDVLPIIKQRWPSISKTLARVSRHQAEAAECLLELAESDFELVAESTVNSAVSINKLLQLSRVRQKNILRYWIEQLNGFDAINSAHLTRILNEVIPAADHSQPKVAWKNTQVCRYRGVLYVLAIEKPEITNISRDWLISDDIELTQCRLKSKAIIGHGIKQSIITDGLLNIRFRQGGERCQPQGRGSHHSLKKLFQEWSVPPWKRSQVPLIYIGDELVQIVGYCLCFPYAAGPQELGVKIESEKL